MLAKNVRLTAAAKAVTSPTPRASPVALKGICSMATRQVLAELAAQYRAACGGVVEIESVGGVDAARRVQAGEAFDLVVLAADAIDRLAAAGKVVASSRVDLMRSPMAVAARTDAPRVDIGSEEALRIAVQAAARIGYSTGPSGTHLLRLLERWGLAAALRDRIVQAPPGVPVATLVRRGDVELGFQQLSELVGVEGVTVLATLPGAAAFVTTFCAGLCVTSARAGEVRTLLDFLGSPAAAPAMHRHGMEPA